MNIGKIENKDLSRFLKKIKNNSDVIVNPRVGEDCAVVNMDGENLIITSDPITSVVKDIGALGVDVNLNDLYSAGATPLGITVTLLFPVGTVIEEIEKLFDEISDKCQKEDINILGGHTEITDAVNRIVVSITAIGKTFGKKYLSYDFKPLDKIYLTKGFALEGTVILLENYFKEIYNDRTCVDTYYSLLFEEGKISKDDLVDYIVDDDNLTEGDFLDILESYKEKMSIKKEISQVMEYNVKAHDVTEGGVFGGLFELLESKNLGCKAVFNYSNVNPVTRRICAHFNISPFKLISSGSSILIVDQSQGENLKNKFLKNNIMVYELGVVTDGDKNITINKYETLLTNNEKDELYKI